MPLKKNFSIYLKSKSYNNLKSSTKKNNKIKIEIKKMYKSIYSSTDLIVIKLRNIANMNAIESLSF